MVSINYGGQLNVTGSGQNKALDVCDVKMVGVDWF